MDTAPTDTENTKTLRSSQSGSSSLRQAYRISCQSLKLQIHFRTWPLQVLNTWARPRPVQVKILLSWSNVKTPKRITVFRFQREWDSGQEPCPLIHPGIVYPSLDWLRAPWRSVGVCLCLFVDVCVCWCVCVCVSGAVRGRWVMMAY